mmetsp:Transcript_10081/g.27427  ORF Transcript_10081/g.27427 Transcript_10081/m.27427 type:complete len:236 (+) Transcript_10081:1123-1830(+)
MWLRLLHLGVGKSRRCCGDGAHDLLVGGRRRGRRLHWRRMSLSHHWRGGRAWLEWEHVREGSLLCLLALLRGTGGSGGATRARASAPQAPVRWLVGSGGATTPRPPAEASKQLVRAVRRRHSPVLQSSSERFWGHSTRVAAAGTTLLHGAGCVRIHMLRRRDPCMHRSGSTSGRGQCATTATALEAMATHAQPLSVPMPHRACRDMRASCVGLVARGEAPRLGKLIFQGAVALVE